MNRKHKSAVKLFTLALTAVFLLSTTAMALTPALTPVDTEIRNQSVATYDDVDGNSYSTTSNEVITVVTAVYALTITPNQGNVEAPGNFTGTAALTQYAAPGTTVYYSYYLKNTGNGPDAFKLKRVNGVTPAEDDDDPQGGTSKIYYDANGNGKVDPGDTLLTAGGVADDTLGATSTRIVEAEETIALILAYQVPVTASDGDEIDVDIDGDSDGGAATDAVSNFSTTTVSDGTGVLTVDKAVNLTEANEGDTLTYTVSGSNTGTDVVQGKDLGAALIDLDGNNATEQRSGVLITDIFSADLDPGLDGGNIANETFAPASATILYKKGVAGEWTIKGNLDGQVATGIALYIPDSTDTDAANDDALDVGQAFSLQFDIDIDDPLDILHSVEI